MVHREKQWLIGLTASAMAIRVDHGGWHGIVSIYCERIHCRQWAGSATAPVISADSGDAVRHPSDLTYPMGVE